MASSQLYSNPQRAELAAFADTNLESHAELHAANVVALLDRASEAIAVLADNPVLHRADASAEASFA